MALITLYLLIILMTGTLIFATGRQGKVGKQWYICCYQQACSFPAALYKIDGVGSRPMLCSRRCLEEGYNIAALSSDQCYCIDLAEAVLLNQSFCGDGVPLSRRNTTVCYDFQSTSPENPQNASSQCPRRGFGSNCLPIGYWKNWAMYTSRGTYPHNVTLFVPSENVEVGMPFLLNVSGHLAALPCQLTGNMLSGGNYFYTWMLPHNKTVISSSPAVPLNCDAPAVHLIKVTLTDYVWTASGSLLMNVTENFAIPFLCHPAVAFAGTSVEFLLKNVSWIEELKVDLGDGNKTTASYTPADGGFVFSHTYSRAGLYYIRVSTGIEEVLSSLIDVQDHLSSRSSVVAKENLTGSRDGYSVFDVDQNVTRVNNSSTRSSEQNRTSVWIYTDHNSYASNMDITFLALTQEPGQLEFFWNFGDGPPKRTASRRITKRYYKPGRYNVSVKASSGLRFFISDIHTVVIQTRIQPNRLLYSASVLVNASAKFDCRMNAGSNVTYAWDFGDGTYRSGRSTEEHVYHSVGEFSVAVTASNLVSSAVLTGQIFVVSEPCQPPPVKNMGPQKIQVPRYQVLRLGVTYEAEIQCNISQGLLYSWALFDSYGTSVQLFSIESHQHNIELPIYFLSYGIYKAIARVEIKGSAVYSNYSVLIEVVSSPPLALISGGTNIFVSRHDNNILTIDGQLSYDPDYPQNNLSFQWECKPLSSVASSCFDGYVSTSESVVNVPVRFLKSSFDQFKFTLSVTSGNRSSTSDVFVTITSDPVWEVHVSCDHCWGTSINWNERISFKALCEDCEIIPKETSYTWKLFQLNTTSKIISSIPFCQRVGLDFVSNIMEHPVWPPTPPTRGTSDGPGKPSPLVAFPEEEHFFGGQSRQPRSAEANRNAGTQAGYGLSISPYDISEFPVLEDGDLTYDDPFTDSHAFLVGSGFHHVFEGSYLDGHAGFFIEEAATGVSGGRHIDAGSNSTESGKLQSWDEEGNNLVDSKSSSFSVPEISLLDLTREQIDPSTFETLTLNGISSSTITFKPFALMPKSLYLLEVSAVAQPYRLQGKTQFIFFTNEIPQAVNCQVQPSVGYEVHTVFSIFCTSGKNDLLYEYSFKTGSSPKRILYQGRDFQYYFNLPSGDPENSYQVTIYIEIRNRLGAATKPCPVTVSVLPSFWPNTSSIHSPDKSLHVEGVRNLSRLLLMGNKMEIHNYILLLSSVLNRLSKEPNPAELLSSTRSVLLATVCQLANKGQGTIHDIIPVIEDLMTVTNQVTAESARVVIRFIKGTAIRFKEPEELQASPYSADVIHKLVLFLWQALEASSKSRHREIQLTKDCIHTTADLVLKFVVFNKALQYRINTSLLEIRTARHGRLQETVYSFDSVRFYLPDEMNMHVGGYRHAVSDLNSSCVISQLLIFKENPYFWGATTQLTGIVADLKMYNCTTRKEITVQRISSPISIEFQKPDCTAQGYSLKRHHMNIHQFHLTPEHLPGVLHITVRFYRPVNRGFPIMLLFRIFNKPTPSLFNIKKIYKWDDDAVHIFLPPSSLNDPATCFLALLNSNYNEPLGNKYITSEVNYTLSVVSVQCLVWDGTRKWKAEGCTPLLGGPNKINCSCKHLGTITVRTQEVQSQVDFTEVSQFMSFPNNFTLCTIAVVLLIVCSLAAVGWKRHNEEAEKDLAPMLLQDNSPGDKQLYGITVNTGLCSRSTMTAKVYLVLHGENGDSPIRELHSSDRRLFKRNTRHTFIMSTAEILGSIQKVHLWHDNHGASPSWYINHIIVKDLISGSSWFFPAECWLALDEQDGMLERTLAVLNAGLGFKKLLYCKLPEYLQDFHLWASVYTCPSHSQFTRSQRLSVCQLLLQGYMCINAMLIWLQEDQVYLFLTTLFPMLVVLGVHDVCAAAMMMGILSVLLVLPLGTIVSLAFRFKKATTSKELHKSKVLDICSAKVDLDAFVEDDLSWYSLQQGAQEKQRKGCQEQIMGCHVYGEKQQECIRSDDISRDFVSDYFSDSTDASKPLHDKLKRKQSDLQPSCSTESSSVQNDQKYEGRSFRFPSWFRYMPWILCLVLTLSCSVTTSILGMRFNTAKTLQWIHALVSSLLFCIFVLQPTAILIGATVVSLQYRHCCDFYSSSHEAVSVTEALQQTGGGHSIVKYPLTFHRSLLDSQTSFRKALAARQRARYLRLSRPPAPAELGRVRDRMKKQQLIKSTVREVGLHTVMLLLLLVTIYAETSASHYWLNQAVKTELTRNVPFQAMHTYEDWWKWTFSTLDRLRWDMQNHVGVNKEMSAVLGTCIVIGEPILKKLEGARNTCKVPRCMPVHSAEKQNEPVNAHRFCGDLACYDGMWTEDGLGLTRSALVAKLQELQARGWLSQLTHALMVQVTLFNPPSGLFTTVSLLLEQPLTGLLLPSVHVESVKVYECDEPLDYVRMTSELLFLLLILLRLYQQLYTMKHEGLAAYWQDIQNWLEAITILLSLSYYAYSVYKHILVAEIKDVLQRENFKAFVDMNIIAYWEQLTRCLQGVMFFLLLVKYVFLLRINRTMAPPVLLLKESLLSLTCPMVTGFILILVLAWLGNLLFQSITYHFSSLSRSFLSVLTHCLGGSRLQVLLTQSHGSHVWLALYYTSISCIISLGWMALVKGILRSHANTVKMVPRRRDIVTVSEMAAYIRDRLLVRFGRSTVLVDNRLIRNDLHLEEFEDVVDELLFRLDAFTDSLHHTLPSKSWYREAYARPFSSQSQHTGSQHHESTSTHTSYECNKESRPKSKCDLSNQLFHIEHESASPALFSFEPYLEQSQRSTAGHTWVSSHSLQDSVHVEPPVSHQSAYGLAQLGMDLPHVLCGSRCARNRTGLCGQQTNSAPRGRAANRKPLKHTHTIALPSLSSRPPALPGAVKQCW